MNFFTLIGAASAFGISLLTATAVFAQDYMCSPYGNETKIPCQVWVNGNKVSVGGFQAAPIYKMQSKWRAIDHRGNKILVTIDPDYTMFYDQEYGTSLRIYGFKY